jgi:hypothetical protein
VSAADSEPDWTATHGRAEPGGPPAETQAGVPAGSESETTPEAYAGRPAESGPGAHAGAYPGAPVGVRGEMPTESYPETPAGPAEPRRPGRTLAVGVAATVVLTAFGALLGLVWSLAAPGVPVIKTERGVFSTQPEPEEFIASDGWFTLLGLGFGVLAAIALWLLLRRYRGPIGMIVLAVGCIGAAVVAWQVGRRIGLGEYHHLVASAPAGQTFVKPPDLRAGGFIWPHGVLPVIRGNLLMSAFGAVVTYTLLAGWSRWPSLQPEPEPAEVAWEPPAAPTG